MEKFRQRIDIIIVIMSIKFVMRISRLEANCKELFFSQRPYVRQIAIRYNKI